MIKKDCFSPSWIDALSEKYNYRDKNLIEKVIHAFSLLEMLSSNGCPMIWKGGSSLMHPHCHPGHEVGGKSPCKASNHQLRLPQ